MTYTFTVDRSTLRITKAELALVTKAPGAETVTEPLTVKINITFTGTTGTNNRNPGYTKGGAISKSLEGNSATSFLQSMEILYGISISKSLDDATGVDTSQAYFGIFATSDPTVADVNFHLITRRELVLKAPQPHAQP
eukprot:TRINITY_DN9581_c0_g4_i1.p2 TRINITY_DN9581_c0_g4~~TRINITY_DN9581_c0_g4_i1.p2  ORF type:complete len:138 (+),score=6.62 TRINITY_DN9581_c0_g4_i1:167-580(+)